MPKQNIYLIKVSKTFSKNTNKTYYNGFLLFSDDFNNFVEKISIDEEIYNKFSKTLPVLKDISSNVSPCIQKYNDKIVKSYELVNI